MHPMQLKRSHDDDEEDDGDEEYRHRHSVHDHDVLGHVNVGLMMSLSSAPASS